MCEHDKALQRVDGVSHLQLWSNRTWSTWLLFWSRKWPSEASNHHFPPLRGLCEGCALPGAEEIFIDLGGGAPKTPIFYAKLTQIRIFTIFAPCDGPCWMACGPLTLKNVRGVLGRTLRAGVLGLCPSVRGGATGHMPNQPKPVPSWSITAPFERAQLVLGAYERLELLHLTRR